MRNKINWYRFKAEVFGRHSTFWNYSKSETIEKLEKFLSNNYENEVEYEMRSLEEALKPIIIDIKPILECKPNKSKLMSSFSSPPPSKKERS